MAKKWQLPADEVTEITMCSSSVVRNRGIKHGGELTLTHSPTGIEVKDSTPAGDYNKAQQRKLLCDLRERLFKELEGKVAKHLRIGGR